MTRQSDEHRAEGVWGSFFNDLDELEKGFSAVQICYANSILSEIGPARLHGLRGRHHLI